MKQHLGRFCIALSLCILLHSSIISQSDSFDISFEKLIEAFIENNELNEFDFYDNFQQLDHLKENKLNLNKADASELGQLFFLTTLQINNIISHRENYGDFLSIEELQSIRSLDETTIRLMKHFVNVNLSVEDQFKLSDYFHNSTSTLFMKYKRVLQPRKGYALNSNGEKVYQGDENHYFMRYKMDAGRKFRLGFTAEKDAGENFFAGNNKYGFDYYTAHAYAEKLLPWLKAIAIGDYTVSFGQGLILNNNFGGGKSAFVTNIKRDDRTLRPYSSVNESNYFRGIAATIAMNRQFDLTGFFSSKKIDGTIVIDSLEDNDVDVFRSIVRDGLHRTTSEIIKKGSITQKNYGGKLSFCQKNLRISINHLTYTFSTPLSSDEAPYKVFLFRGSKLMNTSIDYSYRIRNFNFFGEASRSDNGGIAHIHGMLATLDRKIDFAFSYRNLARDYQVLEANAFSEGTLPINEIGIYTGLELRINNLWKLSSYIDLWQHPWLRYRIDAPSRGKEFLLRVDHTLKRKFNVYIQYRFEQKETNSSISSDKITSLTNTDLHRLRIQLNHKVNKELELRTRAEYSIFNKDLTSNNGYLVFQDVIYKPIGKPYSFTGRYALFDTETFDTRIYTYENDILYEYAIPFFQNQGKRAYINLRYKLNRDLTLEGRYAITQYTNIDTIGSGNEEIIGNSRSDVKFQLRMTF